MSVVSQCGRFVVLRHEDIPDPHFDLMFESTETGRLVSFRSPEWPVLQRVTLAKLADHRAHYLEYEGPISEGRGTVKRLISGFYSSYVINKEKTGLRLYGRDERYELILHEKDDSTAWELEPSPRKAA
jgi:hypothetical protein